MSQHQQRLFMEDVPLLIPDDDNDYSFDSSVELSFFDTPSISLANVQAHEAEIERPFRFAPVRPLELKRRQEQYYATLNATYGTPVVSRSVSGNVVLHHRRPPPPPRASVMPRSPSITSRSSLSDIMAPSFAMTTSSFQPRRLSFEKPAQPTVALRPLNQRYHTVATGSQLPGATETPLRRIASSQPPVSPTDMHFGLERYNAGACDVGLSPDSMSSPSSSESARSNRCNNGSFHAFEARAMQEDEFDHAPMTPSRAGSKALQVLGAYNMPTKPVRNPYKKSSKEHYRPLPAAVFQEIDSFFGFSPQSKQNQSRAQKFSKRSPASQPNLCTFSDEGRKGWKDELECEEYAGLLSQQRSENDERRTYTSNAKSQAPALLPSIKLRSKASMDRLLANRGPIISSPLAPTHDNVSIVGDAHNSWEEGEEDVFGSVGSLSKTANGISLANTRVKERNRLNRQLSHPPKMPKMTFLQSDPYAATPIYESNLHAQPVFKRKQPPPALTLKGSAPSAINKVIVEQIVSGRPSLPFTQLPVRTTSKLAVVAVPQSELPHTPFMAPRTAPVPPGAPKAPGRLLTTTLQSHNSEASDSSGPHTPSTPSPVQPKQSHQAVARPAPTRGMSFFEDSPPPDQTHFRLGVNGKAAMREVSGRIRRVVRL
ncbi:hypothetical protein QFC21_001955 [Naganishia friedmannii]|uniref:Uncharacterized protein n=1 Tax=Naganishia friedmannii TaxID=89922 RepID=A0ACC2W025_9TREE|nr:hypothetical protein QFC21_001955 [Naganishia friedmannii]